MLFQVRLNESCIVSYDIAVKAKVTAKELIDKYPNDKVDIAYSTWSEGKKDAELIVFPMNY